MKKRFLSLMLSLVMCIASVVTFSAVSVSAETEVVPVYLNNVAINFPANDAQPQIISNRTYVPIRATCDALGLSIDWNSKTETLTFTRDGIVISHTMRSKIVYVNGVANEYDTPSINKNNRTLMPIRMLGDSIGATVNWDQTTRSVHILTESAAPDVKVNSLTSSGTAVAAGATVVLTAQASSSTERVKFVNSANGTVISEVSSYVTNSDGTRNFVTDIDCKNDSDEQVVLGINAIPGTNSEFVDSSDTIKNVSIIIAAKDSDKEDEDDSEIGEEEVVKSFESDYFVKLTYTKTVKKNGYVEFTAVTEDDVKRVKVTADDEEVIVKDYEEDDDERIFEGKIKMTEAGNKEIEVDLYVDGEYEDINESFDVTVKKSSSSSDDDDDDNSGDGEIFEVEVVNDIFYTGQSSPIYVTTSKDVDFIEVTADDEDDRVVGKTSFTTTKTSTEKLWTVPITVSETGRNEYTINAYNDDEIVDSKGTTLNGKKFSRTTPTVLSMDQKSTVVRTGEDVRFTAKVTGCVTKLEVRKEGGGSVLGSATSKSSSSSTKSVTITFEAKDSEDYYTIYAYDESGESSDYDFRIAGTVYDEIEITDLEYDDSYEYEWGDPVDLTVYTTNSCEKLWVEDNRGEKVSRTYTKPDDEDGNTYVWEVTFSTVSDNEKNSASFTVIAQGEGGNDDQDEEYITIYFD